MLISQIPAQNIARLQQIKLAVFDVDGVLTDGTLTYTASGEETKMFNALDGHGIKMLMQTGVEVAIISGRESAALKRRAQDQGITQLFIGVHDKRAVFDQLLNALKLEGTQAAGLGDDVIDLPFLTRAGFAACVPAAPAFVKQHVHYITQAHGGRGAAREFCELIMQAQGTLAPLLQKYLR